MVPRLASLNLRLSLSFILAYGFLSILASHRQIVVEFQREGGVLSSLVGTGGLLLPSSSSVSEISAWRTSDGVADASQRSQQTDVVQVETDTTTKLHHHTCSVGNNERITIPAAPSFLVVGAQRSGTSTLAELLWEHPDIVGPSERHAARPFEPHFFDWDFPNEQQQLATMTQLNLTEDELYCRYLRDYAQTFDLQLHSQKPSLLAFEKTPSYLFHGHLPSLILRTCPWKPKIVVILRNPIDRAFSHHNVQVQQKNGQSFEDLIEREVEVMRRFGLTNSPSLKEFSANSTAADNEDWRSSFTIPHMAIDQLAVAHKRLYREVHLLNYLQRSIYWTQLWYWKEVFDGPSDMLVLQYERLYSVDSSLAQSEYNRLLRFLKVSPQRLPEDHNQKHHTRAHYDSQLKEPTRHYLEQFFRAHNAKLADILDDEQWRGVWEDF